jgi:hypothetical protein
MIKIMVFERTYEHDNVTIFAIFVAIDTFPSIRHRYCTNKAPTGKAVSLDWT